VGILFIQASVQRKLARPKKKKPPKNTIASKSN